MIGVSKTFGGSSILSSPALKFSLWNLIYRFYRFFCVFWYFSLTRKRACDKIIIHAETEMVCAFLV